MGDPGKAQFHRAPRIHLGHAALPEMGDRAQTLRFGLIECGLKHGGWHLVEEFDAVIATAGGPADPGAGLGGAVDRAVPGAGRADRQRHHLPA